MCKTHTEPTEAKKKCAEQNDIAIELNKSFFTEINFRSSVRLHIIIIIISLLPPHYIIWTIDFFISSVLIFSLDCCELVFSRWQFHLHSFLGQLFSSVPSHHGGMLSAKSRCFYCYRRIIDVYASLFFVCDLHKGALNDGFVILVFFLNETCLLMSMWTSF